MTHQPLNGTKRNLIEEAVITKGTGVLVDTRITDQGKLLRRKPLTEDVKDLRALIAGIPWVMRIGNKDYEITDRSQMKAMLDEYAELAKLNFGRPEIMVLRRIFCGAKVRGYLRITPAFFQTGRMRLDGLRRLASGQTGMVSEDTKFRQKFGNDAANISPKNRPMGFLVAAACFHTKHRLELVYARTRSKKPIADFRMALYRVLHELLPNKTVTDIGRHFSRDHTTVLYGIKRATEDVEISALYEELVELLRPVVNSMLDSRPGEASVEALPEVV